MTEIRDYHPANESSCLARFGFEAFRTIADGYQAGLDKVFMRRVWA